MRLSKFKSYYFRTRPLSSTFTSEWLVISVNEGVKAPTFTNKYFKELKDDMGINIPLSGSLG